VASWLELEKRRPDPIGDDLAELVVGTCNRLAGLRLEVGVPDSGLAAKGSENGRGEVAMSQGYAIIEGAPA
jgi:hypothetical protein